MSHQSSWETSSEETNYELEENQSIKKSGSLKIREQLKAKMSSSTGLPLSIITHF